MYHQGYILQAQVGFYCLLFHKGSMLLVLPLTCKDLTGISMWLYDLAIIKIMGKVCSFTYVCQQLSIS